MTDLKTGKWAPEDEALLPELYAAGHSHGAIARIIGRSRESIRAKARNLGLKSDAQPPNVPEKIPPEIASYRRADELDGDLGGGLMIAADAQMPCVDWVMATRLATVARKWLQKPRRLLFAGDLLNFDAYSKYDAIVPLPLLDTEIDAAKYAIEELWLPTFDEIIIIPGNHEYRWFKHQRGQYKTSRMGKVLKALICNDERVTFSIHSYITVNCENTGAWRITHPFEYSKVNLSKARFLGHKIKDKHIVMAHQHANNIGLDESGDYVLCDIPALCDPEKLAYVELVDTTKPVMKRGFTMLLNGTLHTFSDHPALTDWSLWID